MLMQVVSSLQLHKNEISLAIIIEENTGIAQHMTPEPSGGNLHSHEKVLRWAARARQVEPFSASTSAILFAMQAFVVQILTCGARSLAGRESVKSLSQVSPISHGCAKTSLPSRLSMRIPCCMHC